MLLRPAFTRQLTDTLLAGFHVNLIAPHGRGRRRTLDDIKSLLPTDMVVQQIDLKREQAHWQAWFEATKLCNEPVIVILHNIEFMHVFQRESLVDLQCFTLLKVSEKPLREAATIDFEIPVDGG